jgi:hypothetical protein
MSWLFFMDESGHDHKNMPLEVRGGVALHAKKLWSFIQGWQRLEQDAFGVSLREFGKEAKGYKLLDRDRLKWAAQTSAMPHMDRRKYARAFLQKGRDKGKPTSTEFAAYGQACVEMARGVFDLLAASEAKLFAAAIPRGVKRPESHRYVDYLRKDHVFLFERFFYFLEARAEHGLIVMDESEKNLDKDFVSRMEAYFTRTAADRNRTHWIIPAPLFVASEMTYAVQAADISLYAINWGLRRANFGAALEMREEISTEFGPKLSRLEWEGDGYRDGRVFRTHGFVFVPDPYERRA